MTCTALGRAEAVIRYANRLGARLSDFRVLVTDAEAFEALDWLVVTMEESAPTEINMDLLKMDIAQAKANGDPWPVVNEFTILGLTLERISESLH